MSENKHNTIDLGFAVARVKRHPTGEVYHIDIFSPSDGNEYGFIPSQHIAINGDGVKALKELLS
ncbi:MAG: hypothetical protein KGL39_18665 [Patescibacteria group bacterium]|nr:hypothetical protein [Patescibacteria group bacterium]